MEAFPEILITAAQQLRWLLDHGYPQTASLKLVGDRHRLNKNQRQLLNRGVDATEKAKQRRGLLVGREYLQSRNFGVDGHNVVLTLANYLNGVPVFECDDGLIRDVGALHGRLHNSDIMNRSIDLLGDILRTSGARELKVFFDAPLSHSRQHAGRLRSILDSFTGVVEVETVPSGDRAIKEADLEVIATSDSGIIDTVKLPVCDLGRYALKEFFGYDFPSFIV